MANDWTSIDFSPGIITYIQSSKQEDMLQVFFLPNYILDMGWYGENYRVSIICDQNWEEPVYSVEISEETEIAGILLDCKERTMKFHEKECSVDRKTLEALIKTFPESTGIFEKHMHDYGELLEHVFYSDVLTEALLNMLEANKEPTKIKKYCDFIEFMWREGEASVKNVVDVSLLERLSDDRVIWQRFGTYISDDFREYINNVAIPENLGDYGVKEL